MHTKTLIAAAAVFVLLANPAKGSIGLDHIRLGSNVLGTTIYIDQEYVASHGSSRDYTGFSMQPGGNLNDYLAEGSFLDEGVRVFFARYGDALARDTIESHSELVWGTTYHLAGTFYLGFYTFRFDASPEQNTDAFGWAKFYGSNGTLTLLDHAVDYGDGGIYVGTTTAVPEPTMMAMLAAGCAALLAKRRSYRV